MHKWKGLEMDRDVKFSMFADSLLQKYVGLSQGKVHYEMQPKQIKKFMKYMTAEEYKFEKNMSK